MKNRAIEPISPNHWRDIPEQCEAGLVQRGAIKSEAAQEINAWTSAVFRLKATVQSPFSAFAQAAWNCHKTLAACWPASAQKRQFRDVPAELAKC